MKTKTKYPLSMASIVFIILIFIFSFRQVLGAISLLFMILIPVLLFAAVLVNFIDEIRAGK